MSRTNATNATSAANEERIAGSMPQQSYLTPKRSDVTVRQDRQATMGCKIRVYVRLWTFEEANMSDLKVG